MLFRTEHGDSSARRQIRMRALAGVTVFAAALTVGCHLDMYDQPKFKPFAANTFYPDKASSRPLVEGTVPRGSLIDDELLASGKINGKLADLFPFPVTRATVMRGQDRFNTFCSPCHGRLADGGGMIVARGFPRPPSLLSDSLRVEPAGFFFDVMTNGFGRMYSYARSVPVGDRWAIVAYLRSLQLSQRVSLAELPEIDRQHFQGSH